MNNKELFELKVDDENILTVLAIIGDNTPVVLLRTVLDGMGWTVQGGKRKLSDCVTKDWLARMYKTDMLASKSSKKVRAKPSVALRLLQQVDSDVYGEVVRLCRQSMYSFGTYWDSYDNVRHAFYMGRSDEFYQRRDCEPYHQLWVLDLVPLFDGLLQLPKDEWIVSNEPSLQWQFAAYLLYLSHEGKLDLRLLYELLLRMKNPEADARYAAACDGLLALCCLWMGREQGLDILCDGDGSWQLGAAATRSFLVGEDRQAQKLFKKSLSATRREIGQRNATMAYPFNLYYQLSLLRSAGPADLQLLIKQQSTHPIFADVAERQLLEESASRLLGAKAHEVDFDSVTERPLTCLFVSLIGRWFMLAGAKSHATELAEWADVARQKHNLLFAQQADSLSGRAAMKGDPRYLPWTEIIQPVERWELSLKALQGLSPTAKSASTMADKRLVWLMDEYYYLEPKEQVRQKSGRWTKGRKVSLKRLAQETESFGYLSDADLRLCRCIEPSQSPRYYSTYESRSFELNNRALLSAIGHPAIFWEDNLLEPVEVRAQPPELLVKEQGSELLLSLSPFPEHSEHEFLIHRRGFNQLDITEFLPQHGSIAEILGRQGLTVPGRAREQVLQSITAIAPLLTIQSDIGGAEDQGAELVLADRRLHLQIQPAGEGLRMAAFVRPFGEQGPLFHPGEGGVNVLSEIEGKRMRSERDLTQESQSLATLVNTSPLFLAESGSDWVFEEPLMALEALEALHSYPDELVMSWPRGKTLALGGRVGNDKMELKVNSQRDWFALEGELKVDEDRVLSLQNLMQLVRLSGSRFIKIGDSEYLALSRGLHQRIEKLSALSDEKGHFHPLASAAVEEAAGGMFSQSSAAWKRQSKRLAEARELQPPLPSTLAAELRDYQREGFEWMMRLAHWGGGACLADDMGLGKTLQALTLLLARASAGPALVLAPTSVCMNWPAEAERFAPTLKMHRFGVGDRDAMLDGLGPHDVLVCSYGLMQGGIERISAIDWHTLIVDEAQALKNPSSLRSKAAASLNADCRVLMTGTPIENHLGELWSLFRVINPGLLGSQKQFEQRFVQPIENGNKQAQQRLKAVVSPFILRRHKSQVLTELPSRTEINQVIEPSEQEKVFYEALRRQALTELSKPQAGSTPTRFKVLAEIMRLRRACCHPKLVMPDTQVPSSKLKAFGNIIDELRENGHRALVFSQFVDHLTLIRQELDSRGFYYQYLDGSTSIKKRQQAVEAFQAGEGDVFLISLKAGGSGLNLTGADYVIHMDPWWNPAVEDQASDRAHRMGQLRPVTIYRFIMAGSIEEKILDMHKKKRELADSLLEGNEVASSVDVDQMLELLHDSVME